jgi:hypothetical protein
MSDDYTDWADDLTDSYWEQERVNDRDEYDQHVRHTEDEERERLDDHGT